MRGICCTLAVLLTLTAASACKEDGAAPAEKKTTTQDGAFCAEHGVLEAVCTKCNPSLVPVFKAKGDWCAEHDFPESFCPICHPEQGGKPVADVSSDGAPADGTKVRFRTKEAAALAGIETVQAKKRPGGVRLAMVATVVYDARRYAEVNARAPGVIKKLHVDVGAAVKVGAPLATIESSSVASSRSRLRSSATRVDIAKVVYDRERKLRDLRISPEATVLAARREWEDAKAQHAAARAALAMVGTGGGQRGYYLLRAPIAGTVASRKATIGHMVGTEAALFEVVDTSTMWVELDVPENKLATVATGQKVEISLDAFPRRKWRGTIGYIATAVDLKTRTAKARVVIPSPDGQLRANMYGRGVVELADAKPTIMVPRMAVQRAGGATLVFVKLAEDVYEARRVRVGLTDGPMVELLAGAKPGEQIATKGSFLLKTETLKGSIGAGCCDVE